MGSRNESRIETAMQAVNTAVPLAFPKEVVGSAFYCGQTDSDVDILVLADTLDIELQGTLHWNLGGSVQPTDVWRSYKTVYEGVEVNMLLVTDALMFLFWKRCAVAARAIFKLNGDIDRYTAVAIHQAVIDGMSAEDIAGLQ